MSLETIVAIVSICAGIISIWLGAKKFIEDQPSIHINREFSLYSIDITITNTGNKIIFVDNVSVKGYEFDNFFLESSQGAFFHKPRKIDVGESVLYCSYKPNIESHKDRLAEKDYYQISVRTVNNKVLYGMQISSETLLNSLTRPYFPQKSID